MQLSAGCLITFLCNLNLLKSNEKNRVNIFVFMYSFKGLLESKKLTGRFITIEKSIVVTLKIAFHLWKRQLTQIQLSLTLKLYQALVS